jgi:hypothetical protein
VPASTCPPADTIYAAVKVRLSVTAALALAGVVLASAAISQGREGFIGSFSDPAIDYLHAPLTDRVSTLARRLEDGSAGLTFDSRSGYLPSVLRQLEIALDSQVLVYSQTSLQAPMIGPRNPRALYFNDDAAVGWVRGAPALEFAALDPRQGVVFYRLDQQASPRPRLQRSTECLRCHIAWETLAVPGMMVLSTGPDDAAGYATGGVVDHRDPIASRWGSWFVTGRSIPPQHLGTAVTQPPWAAAKSDLNGYPTAHSDVVALMVLEHQTHAANLLTYLGWEARIGASPGRLDAIVQQVADYFLFVDEPPLPRRVEGSSGFAERFAAQGPRDDRGRSLRQFDLEHRLMRYPCSYMIYAPAFGALPSAIKIGIYRRMSVILDGSLADRKYARFTEAERRAVLEILRNTITEFPR